jgi:hypothetical protein
MVCHSDREPHNMEIVHSPIIIQVIKSNTIIWAGHVAHIREMSSAYKILVKNLTGRDYFDEKIIF